MIEQAEKLNNQSIILAGNGSYAEAIACLKRAITLQQNNYLLWYNLGVTYRDSGDLESAYEALHTACQLNSENEDCVEAFATLCIAQRKLNQASQICSDFLHQNPYSAHFWNLLGVINFQEEDYSSAAEFFEQAVYINPYYEDALYNLKDTYSMLNIKSGQTECERKLKEIRKS